MSLLSCVPLVPTFAAVGWSATLFAWVVDFGLLVLGVSILLCLIRIVRGPHLADRAISADTIAVLVVGVVVLLSIRQGTVIFLDGVLVLSLLGFAGTIAAAHFIARPYIRRFGAESDGGNIGQPLEDVAGEPNAPAKEAVR